MRPSVTTTVPSLAKVSSLTKRFMATWIFWESSAASLLLMNILVDVSSSIAVNTSEIPVKARTATTSMRVKPARFWQWIFMTLRNGEKISGETFTLAVAQGDPEGVFNSRLGDALGTGGIEIDPFVVEQEIGRRISGGVLSDLGG